MRYPEKCCLPEPIKFCYPEKIHCVCCEPYIAWRCVENEWILKECPEEREECCHKEHRECCEDRHRECCHDDHRKECDEPRMCCPWWAE